MKRFDYGKLASKKAKEIKRNSFLFGGFTLAYAAVLAIGIILSTYQNKTLFMVIFSVVLSVLSIFVIYFLFFGIIFAKKDLKRIQQILDGYLIETKGVVEKILPPITLSNGRIVNEILLKSESGESTCYFDKEFGEVSLTVGCAYVVRCSEGIVIEAEDLYE
ncbi:MAG: hypothetical protein MJ239_04500 [Bacilli bacterium]|nr:hypothetical protein [Bacilli bacterium]